MNRKASPRREAFSLAELCPDLLRYQYRIPLPPMSDQKETNPLAVSPAQPHTEPQPPLKPDRKRVDEILRLVRELDYASKLSLLERLVRDLQKYRPQEPPPKPKRKPSDLIGIAEKSWEGIDSDKYIEQSRRGEIEWDSLKK